MIDRKKGPKITTEFDLSLKGVKQSKLENGLELYEVNSGTQNIIKVEIVFRTGRIHETHRASANAALSLIREGSTRHSAQELAYQYDFYGAAVKASCNMEYASVSLVVLERYFSQIWPTWLHMVLYPQFDKKEVEKYSAVKTQKLVNQLAKNNVQSYRRLTEHIFGSEHPYGYNTEPSDIAGLQREMVLDYFNNNLGFDNAYILMSGRYTEATRAKIVNDIGSIKRKNNHPETVFERANITPSKIYVQTENDIQTSIKLGRTLFPRKHPHFGKTNFLSTVLGGYFGSRLMKKIREEKGYTYGIYSSVHSWEKDGFIYISADVDNTYIEPTLEEIHSEMEKLYNEKVPSQELEMVRSYILGQALHLLDGPFAKIQLIKELKAKNLDAEDFDKFVKLTKSVNSDDLIEMAQLYLNPDDYSIVLSGESNGNTATTT